MRYRYLLVVPSLALPGCSSSEKGDGRAAIAHAEFAFWPTRHVSRRPDRNDVRTVTVQPGELPGTRIT